MAESKRVLDGMVVLSRSGKGLVCTEISEFSFPNDKGEIVEGRKVVFVPLNPLVDCYSQVGFTGMKGSVTYEIISKLEKRKVYNIGIDINNKGKTSLVDFEEVI